MDLGQIWRRARAGFPPELEDPLHEGIPSRIRSAYGQIDGIAIKTAEDCTVIFQASDLKLA
jgi:hypothetical protein